MNEQIDPHKYLELIVGEEEIIALLLNYFSADDLSYYAERGQVVFRKYYKEEKK